MEQRSCMPRVLVFVLLPFFVLLFVLGREQLALAASQFPDCPINSLFGVLCPGCGMTRSILSMLKGDFAGAIRFHAAPVVLFLLTVLFYLEMVFSALGRKLTLIPKKMGALYILLGALFVYLLLRNFIP